MNANPTSYVCGELICCIFNVFLQLPIAYSLALSQPGGAEIMESIALE